MWAGSQLIRPRCYDIDTNAPALPGCPEKNKGPTPGMSNKYAVTPVYDEASFEMIQDAAQVPAAVVAAALQAQVTDASETMVFARQLETIKNRVFEKKYAELKGRQLVPFSYEGGAASEFLTYRVWDFYGMAKVVSNYATDFPMVDASASEYFVKYVDIGASYGYSVMDLRQAAKAGVALTDRKAMAARRVIELGIDDAVSVGIPQAKTYGLANHPNVSLQTLPTGTWASASGENILIDLNSILTDVLDDTLEIFAIDTLVMSTAAFRLISTKLLNSANGSNITVLEAFKAQNPGVTVMSWTRLNLANAAGTNGRMIAYKRDSEVLEFEMGQEFEIFPAEQHGLMLTHVCKARVGGVVIHHPLAVRYVDAQNL